MHRFHINIIITIAVILFSGTACSNESVEVLLIGDSHTCMSFGIELDGLLRNKYGANEVITIGRSGERTEHYLKGNHYSRFGWMEISRDGQKTFGGEAKLTPSISSLIKKHSPRKVIIALGANEIWLPSDLDNQLTKLASIITKTSECIWIAPPATRCDITKCIYSNERLQRYYSILYANVGKMCTIVKSDPQTLPYLDFNKIIKETERNGDGIHFDSLGETGRNVAKKWASDIFTSI